MERVLSSQHNGARMAKGMPGIDAERIWDGFWGMSLSHHGAISLRGCAAEACSGAAYANRPLQNGCPWLPRGLHSIDDRISPAIAGGCRGAWCLRGWCRTARRANVFPACASHGT
jgi:hypothetical protein